MQRIEIGFRAEAAKRNRSADDSKFAGVEALVSFDKMGLAGKGKATQVAGEEEKDETLEEHPEFDVIEEPCTYNEILISNLARHPRSVWL